VFSDLGSKLDCLKAIFIREIDSSAISNWSSIFNPIREESRPLARTLGFSFELSFSVGLTGNSGWKLRPM